MVDDTHPTYLSPSELGTKDYWENYYARTLAHISNSDDDNNATTHHGDNHPDINDEDDPGTSWFSEHSAPEKVLRFLTRSSFPLSPRNTLRCRSAIAPAPASDPAPATKATSGHESSSQPCILDLGTGNGSMLALLRKKGGFVGTMVGVDYSTQSIELARELQRSKGHSAYRTDSEDEDEGEISDDSREKQQQHQPGQAEGAEQDMPSPGPIRFEEWDILASTAVLSPSGVGFSPSPTDETLAWFPYAQGGFDIVLDKGTFDAISLAGDARDTRVCERYPDIVRQLIRNGGFLVITSCNWTEEELVKWFTSAGIADGQDRFEVWGRVEYPRFRFGGKEGQGVCTVCFQRVMSA